MTESLITISIIGLIAGFIFSMPIAGPISILITSNALKGRLKYCNLMAIGASVADFIYVFIAIYGISRLFSVLREAAPYILGFGAIFVLVVGIKILLTRIDIESIDEKGRITDKRITERDGAFYTGFMVNFLNPTIFFGWLLSSFIALSFAASIGFDTGGLNTMVDRNLNQVEIINGLNSENRHIPSYLQFDTLNILKKENHLSKNVNNASNHHLLTSLFYSVSLSTGSFIWFFLLAMLLIRFRKEINIGILNWFIRGLGLILCLFAVYFGYSALKMLF